jgi:hypothetical protein
MCLGTFARVWLARLKGQDKDDQDKLYALKVLRKAEGKLHKSSDDGWKTDTWRSYTIKTG